MVVVVTGRFLYGKYRVQKERGFCFLVSLLHSAETILSTEWRRFHRVKADGYVCDCRSILAVIVLDKNERGRLFSMSVLAMNDQQQPNCIHL